jgi:hypothetical protein
MILYHYTSGYHLRGIARYGLTVGDVPTDIEQAKGRVGVWLTSAPTGGGHGLEGSTVDKKQYRLAVEVPEDSPLLVKWLDWAPGNVTPNTIEALHSTAAEHDGEGPASWFVFFGVLAPNAIRSCSNTLTGEQIKNWCELPVPNPLDAMAMKAKKGVPAWRRDAWHRQLIKSTTKAGWDAARVANPRHLHYERNDTSVGKLRLASIQPVPDLFA